ncbi:flavohemoprotein [Paecilomyces variotii No. 5]|uniref:nitric oxide dioxygenase n=1 Tax=Byssochlamys spectabilis (strain No. 5 / NBRC 109023) TaxID=1356009 RepID=V5G252_BYSSN|nr:flavohemoprotein [Paecilomyces variotii No. 5]
MTPEQINIIKATVPVIGEHGYTVTTVFYKNLLSAHPELNSVFNTTSQETGHQSKALSAALYAYAANIDNLGALSAAVELICNKHASLHIQPDHYKIVGKYLIEAMQEVLGAAFTPDIQDSWAAAYWQLAEIMINREAALYKESTQWTSWRDFRISKKIPESDEITSFYLEPVDGKPLPTYLPGQYISVQTFVPRLGYTQARQYSLSDMPDPHYYRISVKREVLDSKRPGTETHPGYVSNVLHDLKAPGDIIQLSHPHGDFFLSNPQTSHPVVLIAAGVGLTPLISMLNSLASNTSTTKRDIHFIHASRTTKARAFKESVQKIARGNPKTKATFFVERPEAGDRASVDYTHAGRVDLQRLRQQNDLFLDNPKTEYYICGPSPFMQAIQAGLLQFGVGSERIKMELFGAGGPPASEVTSQARL